MFENVDKLKNIEASRISSSEGSDDLDLEKDINLLPDDMRKEDGHKKKDNTKKTGDSKVEMHVPEHPLGKPKQESKRKKQPKEKKKGGFSLFRFFKNKPKKSPNKKIEPGLFQKKSKSEKKTKLKPEVYIPKDTPRPKSNIVAMHEVSGGKEENDILEEELDVNLLPERKHKMTSSQIVVSYIMAFVFCIFAVVTPYIYFLSENKVYTEATEQLKKDISRAKVKHNELKEEALSYTELAERLDEITKLLTTHVYWSRFLPVLEKHTVGNVYFISMDVRSGYNVSVSGVAKDIRAIAEQLVVYQNSEDFTEVTLDSISFAVTGENVPELESGKKPLGFTINFTIDPEIIYDIVPEVDDA